MVRMIFAKHIDLTAPHIQLVAENPCVRTMKGPVSPWIS